jgi:mannose-6-phosphate isomerase-like protein (cupin superfamily)
MDKENESRGSMHIIRKEDLPLIGSSYNFVGAEHGNVEVSLFLVEAKPGRGAPLHCHDYDEIIVVQEGSSRFVSGDEIRDTAPGDILVVKAGTPHGFVNTGTGILKQIDIHHSPHFKQANLAPTETSCAAGLPQ